MSTLAAPKEPQRGWEPAPAEPLDKALWQAWVEKGRAHDRRRSDVVVKAVRWVSIVVLLTAAGLWTHLTPYEVLVRFIVAGGAMAGLLLAIEARNYASAAVFAVLALLYNPVFPAFSFSGDWQRGLLAASIVPFAASAAWRNKRRAQHV